MQLAVVLNSDFLKAVPVFKFADRRCVAILVMCMRGSIYMPQELVIQEGAVGQGIYFVRMGRLEVSRAKQSPAASSPSASRNKTNVYEDPDTEKEVLAYLTSGNSFGEQSFLARTPSLASVCLSPHAQCRLCAPCREP